MRHIAEVTDWALPDDVHLRPVQAGEQRLLVNGERHLFNEAEGTTYVELPAKYFKFPFKIQSHTTDRCATNSSMLHFMACVGFLVAFFFDCLHSKWNTIRNTSKRAGEWAGRKKGWVWARVLEFLTIANMNAGPYRSGQWFDVKKDACIRWPRLHNIASPDFLEIVGRLAKRLGKSIATESGMQELGRLPRSTVT